MSGVPVRPDLGTLEGYHSPQVAAEVRLNTNESPFPPPTGWRADLRDEVERIEFHRYPDREAVALRRALAEFHGVEMAEVFCANGSNEALQCLCLAYGGPGRRAGLFEPTYALHRHISEITGTEVVDGERTEDFALDSGEVARVLRSGPTLTFLCSPNNPTGRVEPPDVVRQVLAEGPGLVVVDEAYGQFAPSSALELRRRAEGPVERLVVVRTFSKTWAMAGARLGYLVADPEVVAACEHVALPYHLSSLTQAAGRLALRYRPEMEARVALVAEERGRLAAGLAGLPVETWPSDANFVLFRPLGRSAHDLWQELLDHSILVRDFSSRPRLEGCLRVTVGTPAENDRFLEALSACLR